MVIRKICIVLIAASINLSGFSQVIIERSALPAPIADPLRIAMGQLVYEASHQPYDSSEYYLKKYPFDSLNVPWDKLYIYES
jgi:hypothetical protein